jgi:hypothetical protein
MEMHLSISSEVIAVLSTISSFVIIKNGDQSGENTKGANIFFKSSHNGFFSHSPKGPKGIQLS